MHFPHKNQKEKIDAALQLLLEETTTFAKFEKIRILIKGINPKIDKTLASCSDIVKKLKKIQKSEILELSIGALPEHTEEQKKRKKYLLLFIFSWKDLRVEVARVQRFYQQHMASGKMTTQDYLASASKLTATAKGPFGLITALAVVIVGVGGVLAYLNSTAVNITIKNQGCSPITPVVKLPVSIPGIKLLTEIIPSGGYALVSVPAFTVNVDGTKKGSVVISAFKFTMEYRLGGSNNDLIFDSQSLIGKNTTIDLFSSKNHTLIISCPMKRL